MLSLKYLSLSDNLLTNIPEFLFNKLVTLVQLNLQNNIISKITSNSLSGMPNLVALNMKGNRLPILPVGIFDAVGNLQTLLLANNSIQRVNQNPFQAQRRLITLDLSDNLIETVTPDWFTAAGQTLQTLWLNNNRILTINVTSLSRTLPQLVQLDLSDNLLTSVNDVFSNWQSLITLALSGNPLGLRNGGIGLTGAFYDMTSLQSLDLRGSCLTSMEPGLQLPSLKNLMLASNQLTNVSTKMLAGITGLLTLDISDNNIALVEPRSFAPLTLLAALDISGNALTGNQLQSAGISPSTTVDLSWNAVTSVESVPRQDGGVYLRGNPLICADCGVGGTSTSWWPADRRILLDANQTTCLQSNRLPAWIMCQCSSTSSSSACNTPLSASDTPYLFGIQQSPQTCPYDVSMLNPYRPRFVRISARPSSQTSVVVSWNVTDLRSSAAFVHILVVESPDCFNASSAVNISEFTTFASSSVHSVNDTFCDVTNLTSSTIYAVCGQVLVTSTGSSNSTLPSDSACTCVQTSVDAVVQDVTSSILSSTPQSSASSTQASNVFLIIVIAVPVGAFLIVLIIICVVVVLCAARRRRTQQKAPPSQPQHFASEQPPPIWTTVSPAPKVEDATPDADIDIGDDDDTMHLAHQSQVSLSVYDNVHI